MTKVSYFRLLGLLVNSPERGIGFTTVENFLSVRIMQIQFQPDAY